MENKWIEWDGGRCPVTNGVLVDVKLRNSNEYLKQSAWQQDCPSESRSSYAIGAYWRNDGADNDIIAWRLHQPEQPAWSGEGLPPVGTECEVAKPLHNAGTKVRVLCHDEGAAVCRVVEGDDLGDLCQLEAFEVSPIRTEAELRREEVIKEMTRHVTNFNKTDVTHAIIEIYDAIAADKIPGLKLHNQ